MNGSGARPFIGRIKLEGPSIVFERLTRGALGLRRMASSKSGMERAPSPFREWALHCSKNAPVNLGSMRSASSRSAMSPASSSFQA